MKQINSRDYVSICNVGDGKEVEVMQDSDVAYNVKNPVYITKYTNN